MNSDGKGRLSKQYQHMLKARCCFRADTCELAGKARGQLSKAQEPTMVVSQEPIVVGKRLPQLSSTLIGNGLDVAARASRPIYHYELKAREAICLRDGLA